MRLSIITILFILGSLAVGKGNAQSSIEHLSVTGADGKQYSLRTYAGKILWFVLVPTSTSSSDSAFLARVDSISLAHKGSVQTVAVPSSDDGAMDNGTTALIAWYKALLDPSIIIAKPIFTHKTSGSKQDMLFQWLTHAAQNTHFDDEVAGIGSSYFVDAKGSLYAVFEPEAMFSNKAFKKVLP